MKVQHWLLSFSAGLCWLLAPTGSEAQGDDGSSSKWGPWSEWKPCSRTCGVGVSYQERECQEKERPDDFCRGGNRIYRTCNIQDCPEGSRDFRLEQCEAFNNRIVDGQRFKWVPYIPVNGKCVLNCMPKGEYFFMRWADKVVDGTTCNIDTYDICVDGRCEKLGCDLILNSNAKEDKCRVCNGKGQNCKTQKGVNKEEGDGYKEILTIPASATNIDIQEMAPSTHFLALSDVFRNYFFNGGYLIKNPAKYKVAGTVFTYERTRFGQERIFALGPTTVPVQVEVLFMEGEKNPGISYEYSVPNSVVIDPKPSQFSWRTGEFDKCSKTCAGGERKRRVFCVRDDNGEEVSDSDCAEDQKPSHKKRCNTQPCPSSWFVSAWSACSTTCGQGKQVRRVHCQRAVEGGETAIISDDQCSDPKPITMRACHMEKNCPEWSMGQWSSCSASCGMGNKYRNVTCEAFETGAILPQESCDLASKPKETEKCNPGPCTVTWLASNWSECYPKCGKGMSTRMVYCVGIANNEEKYPDELCDISSRPISKKECLSKTPCPAMWHASQWSRCTATCGLGMQMRNVLCAKREGAKTLRIMPSDQCKREQEMSKIQKCSVRPCQAGWYIYPWEPCSKSCGQGVRQRSVKCFADSKEDIEEKWCKAEDKPVSEEICVEKECEVPVTVTTTEIITTTEPTTQKITTVNTMTKVINTAAETTTVPPLTTPETTTEPPLPTRETTTVPPLTTPESTTVPPSTTPETTTVPPLTTPETTTVSPPTAPETTTVPPSTTPETTTVPPTTARKLQAAQIVQPPKDTMAYVGTEVLFRCRATGYPAPVISWRKGAVPVSSLDSERIQILKNGDLRIIDIKQKDNDVYSCFATNWVGPMHTVEARLAVIVPVSISVSPKNKTVSPGEDVKITCKSGGVPSPIVEWYKDNSLISKQGRVRVSRTDVVISQVQPSDSGYYQCSGRNNYSGASDQMYLYVVKREEPTEPPYKCEDNPAIAHCQIVRRVNYCCIPYYKKACCKTCEDLLPSCDY
ncbi:papilin isoform X2 [Pocillopora verrucosa]